MLKFKYKVLVEDLIPLVVRRFANFESTGLIPSEFMTFVSNSPNKYNKNKKKERIFKKCTNYRAI